MDFPQHISYRDLRGNSIFIKAQIPPPVYYMPNVSLPACSACGSIHCTVESNQTYFLSCLRANRRAVAGSERPEVSLLLRVEWREPCDVHQMAAPASCLHRRPGALRGCEGAGMACTHLTAMHLLAASTQNRLCAYSGSIPYIFLK